MTPSIYMDTDATMTTMSWMFAERTKQQVVGTTNYVEENVVSELQCHVLPSFLVNCYWLLREMC